MKTYKSLIISIGLVTLINVLLIAGPGMPATDPQCSSGGPGASTCEVSQSFAGGLFNASCSVSCNAGQYACCWITWNQVAKCICKTPGANSN